MEEEWPGKDYLGTNMKWNLEEPVVWEMIFLDLTVGEMLSTNLMLMVNH